MRAGLTPPPLGEIAAPPSARARAGRADAPGNILLFVLLLQD